MPPSEAATRWEARYLNRTGPLSPPDPLVRELAPLLPSTGRALDLAGGDGRHAIWLANRGLDVTLADVSSAALARATAAARAARVSIETHACDLESSPPPAGPWQLIVIFHYLHRGLFSALVPTLATGGMVLQVQPTTVNLERHARPSARWLLQPGELPALLPPALQIVAQGEGWQSTGRHEAWVLASKI